MAKERLDALLVARGLAGSRERAKRMIMAGEVLVDGQKVDKAGTTVKPEAEILTEKGGIALLAVGSMVGKAQQAAELLAQQGIEAGVVNMRFVKPLDEDLLAEYIKSKQLLVTIEENVLAGGFGSAVAEYLADRQGTAKLLRMGLPDEFIEQGTHDELLDLVGLQPQAIADRVKSAFEG